ncbi:MAG: cytochrome P450, partial [Olpidium bornovanus]
RSRPAPTSSPPAVLNLRPRSDNLWKAHRKALQPGFGPTHLAHAAEASDLVGDELVDQWSAFADAVAASAGGDPAVVDVRVAAACATLDVLGHVVFSYGFGSVRSLAAGDGRDGRTFGTAAPVHDQFEAYDGIFRVMGGRLYVPKPLWALTGGTAAAMKPSRDAVVSAVASVLEEKKRGRSADKPESRKDFMDHLLDADKFTEEDVTDETIAFFLAGFETSANTLTTCIMCVAEHPEVMKKLQEEVDLVLGPSGKVTMDALASLKYTEQVIVSDARTRDVPQNAKETLRLHPTVPALRRHAVRDTTLGGHAVAKGTAAVVCIQGLHRKKEYWDRPLAFDPDRWSPSGAA